MKTGTQEATDGRKLVFVETNQRTADADAPVVKVTFELYTPDNWAIKTGTLALLFLSSVRTDTLETVQLDRSHMREVYNAAIQAATQFDPDW
jgi:hypothetical protein